MKKQFLLMALFCSLLVRSQEIGTGIRAPSISIHEWIRKTSLPEMMKIHELEKPLVIDFFATWCQPCRLAMPHLERLSEEFEGRADFLVISNEKPAVLENFFGVQAGKINIAADLLGKTHFAYGVSLLPATFFISTDGIIRWSGRPEALHPKTLEFLISGRSPEAVDSLGAVLGTVDTKELNRVLLGTFEGETVYQIEVIETTPSGFEVSSSDHHLNIRGSLFQIVGLLSDVISEQRLEYTGDRDGPFLQVRIASERKDVRQLRRELMQNLEVIYGFRTEEVVAERTVFVLQSTSIRKFPDDTLFGSPGTTSQLVVIPDSLIYADNITLNDLAIALENQYGTAFINETGDHAPRDWRIPLQGMENLEAFLESEFGIVLARTPRPIRLTRVEFPGE